MFFLPRLPLALNQLVWVGVLLAAGLAAGELARRHLRLPRITGYAAAGLALGPGGSALIDPASLADLKVFVDISIGLVLFELGQRLDLAWLRRSPWLALMGVAESGLAAALVFFTLFYYFDYAALPAAVAAAIAVSTSPAVLMRVAADLRAEGQVTDRALILVAINSVLAFLALTVLLPWLHLEYRGGWTVILAHPLYLMGGSLAVAWLAARATLAFAAFLGKRADRQFIAAVAMIVLTVGLAVLLKLSVLLTLLAFGALVRNADRDHRLMVVDFGSAGQLFYVILFVVTGASLDLSLLATVGLPALAFVLVRFAGKALGVLLFAAPAGVSLQHASLLALALTPMSGLAVVMVHETSVLYPQLSASVAPVVFAAVAILELAGPIAAQFALKRAGETSPEERA